MYTYIYITNIIPGIFVEVTNFEEPFDLGIGQWLHTGFGVETGAIGDQSGRAIFDLLSRWINQQSRAGRKRRLWVEETTLSAVVCLF